MSAFSEQLRVALDAAELSQSQLAELTNISQPTISRYLKGDMSPEPELFGALLDNLPDSLHFELIVARLADELPKKYRDAVTILAHGGNAAVREEAAPYIPAGMARDLRRAFDHLAREAIQQPDVRSLILALAKALGSDYIDLDASGEASSSLLDKAVEEERRRRNQANRDRKSS